MNGCKPARWLSNRQKSIGREPPQYAEGAAFHPAFVGSLADLARSNDASTAEAALSGISEPGGDHNQSTDGATAA